MKRALHDLASLAARMGVGGIFFANGWHKLEAGLTATATQFADLHAPLPDLWAAVTMLIELLGGVMLIAGLAVPAIGLVLFAEALAVFVLTAGDTGLPLTGGDIRLIVALGAASALLAVVGAGRVSIDHMVVIKRREAEAADDFAAESEADAVIAALRPSADAATAGSPGTGAVTTAPETTAPEATAPEGTAPETKAPGKKAPKTTGPKTGPGDAELSGTDGAPRGPAAGRSRTGPTAKP
ncbi:DoxX family membrane protein [Microbispora sp. RL4-1S]|uniref:DoxX family membrane protein n=1 Tax=Microbispora oryzae TaxID=2806554 RepID=A0A940WJ01_9ACTN|nr:DoxX family protein [Microbispora oryzae]MBP2706609.1 DoxX family membrane protein [Microbispora oryzae]